MTTSTEVARAEKGAAHERELPPGWDDPHRAALEDNPEHAEKLTLSVVLSAIFLGTSFTGPIIFGFITVTPILVQLSQELGGSNIDFWIPSGWGAAAAVGFTIAGRISDIFGRRYVILFGQALTVVAGIVACTANDMHQLIAGEVLFGAAIGIVSVAYAGKFDWATPVDLMLTRKASLKSSRTSIVEQHLRGPRPTLLYTPFLPHFLPMLASRTLRGAF
jgi:hypothetical protein